MRWALAIGVSLLSLSACTHDFAGLPLPADHDGSSISSDGGAALDALALDAAASDASFADAASLDATANDAANLDASALDATELDATALDASDLDAAPGDAPSSGDGSSGDAAGSDGAPSDAALSDAAPSDAAPSDAASNDGGADAAPNDSGIADSGRPDSGDAGNRDAGIPDTGATRGDCKTNSDCGGDVCTTIPTDPRGYHTCIHPVPEATMCSGNIDACGCGQLSCPVLVGLPGGCFLGPLFFCGGHPPQPHNFCLQDDCEINRDCGNGPNGLCLPAGAWGEPRKHCVYGDCVFDSDCTSNTGGQCSPFFSPCTNEFIGFNCTYDFSACRKDADCPAQDEYCKPGVNGATQCEVFIPPP